MLQQSLYNPFVVSMWFDKLTMIGTFPNVLSEVEGQAQGERGILKMCLTQYTRKAFRPAAWQ